MQKARLRQAELDDASYPCGMNDGAYFGYWSKEEVLNFLKELPEIERIGVNAFAAIGRAADAHVADLASESELAQGAICVLLNKDIATRWRTYVVSSKYTTIPTVKCSLQTAIGFRTSNQTTL